MFPIWPLIIYLVINTLDISKCSIDGITYTFHRTLEQFLDKTSITRILANSNYSNSLIMNDTDNSLSKQINCLELDNPSFEVMNETSGNSSMILKRISNTGSFEGRWKSHNNIPYVNASEGSIVMYLQTSSNEIENVTYDRISFSVKLFDDNSDHDRWVLIQNQNHNKTSCPYKNMTYLLNDSGINLNLKGDYLGILFLEADEESESQFEITLIPEGNKTLKDQKIDKTTNWKDFDYDSPFGIDYTSVSANLDQQTEAEVLKVLGISKGFIKFEINSVKYIIDISMTMQINAAARIYRYTSWTNTMALLMLMSHLYLIFYFEKLNSADTKFVSPY